MASVTPQGRTIGPVENYQVPDDLCGTCTERWATWSALDLATIFVAGRLCDACTSSIGGTYELLPYAPRRRHVRQ